MFGNKMRPVAEVCIDSKLGFGSPDFTVKANKTFNLTILLICLFLKTGWLFAGQEELSNFKDNFRDLIEDDKFPDNIRGISAMPGIVKAGKTTLTLYKNKSNDIGFVSYFPFSYSNIDIINIGVVFIDKITALFDDDSKTLCRETFRFFKDIILDDNEDESNERLAFLFGFVSEFIKQLENT